GAYAIASTSALWSSERQCDFGALPVGRRLRKRTNLQSVQALSDGLVGGFLFRSGISQTTIYPSYLFGTCQIPAQSTTSLTSRFLKAVTANLPLGTGRENVSTDSVNEPSRRYF